MLQHHYFDLVKSGKKCVEMRSNGPYWQSRVKGATHCSFSRAFSDTCLPPKKIDSVKVIPVEEVVKYGGPEPGTAKFKELFQDWTECMLIKFQPYTEEEVEGIPDKKSQATLASLKKQGRTDLKEMEVMDAAKLFQPDATREPYDPKKVAEWKLRDIQFPQNLLSSFIQSAWNQSSDKEFMGWVTGKLHEKGQKAKKKTIVIANGLFIPRQKSDQWSVWEAGDDQVPSQMLQFMEESESVVVGWIHSHPTFSSFLSSVDQHTQHRLQKDLAQAFAIVIDQHKQPRVMRLSPAGMEVVAKCQADPANFHEHDISNEDMVVDLGYFIHHSGKFSKLAFFDQNNFRETFGQQTFEKHSIFLFAPGFCLTETCLEQIEDIQIEFLLSGISNAVLG